MAEVKELLAEFRDAKTQREQNWDGLWDDVAELTLPRRSGFTHSMTPGQERRSRIIDPTAERSNIAFAAMLGGQLINPELQWFTLRFADPELNGNLRAVEWLLAVRGVINRVFESREARFHQRANEVFLDLGAFGTGVFYVEQFDNDVGVRFAARPLNEMYFKENAGGNIDTAFRSYELDRRQFLQEFGEDALSERLEKEWKKGVTKRLPFMHVVKPNDAFEAGKVDAAGMAFMSAHISVQEERAVREGGFREFPYMVPRWIVATGEIYGRGPGVTALPDNRMLQRISETTIRALQKRVDPPLQAPDDGFLGPVVTVPSAINYYRAGSRDRIEPINTGSEPQIGEAFMERIRENVAQAFFIDLNILDQPEPRVAATAILDRRDERFRRMVPMTTRVQADFLAPLIERVFALASRAGALPEPPEDFEGAQIDVDFVSPAALAQAVSEADNITRYFQRVLPLLEVDPQAVDRIDVDETLKVMQKLLSASPEIIRDDDEVAEIRAARAQQQQIAAGLQQAQQGTDILRGVAEIGQASEPTGGTG